MTRSEGYGEQRGGEEKKRKGEKKCYPKMWVFGSLPQGKKGEGFLGRW